MKFTLPFSDIWYKKERDGGDLKEFDLSENFWDTVEKLTKMQTHMLFKTIPKY